MIAAVLGIAGLVLALFTVGGFMEGDMGKVAKFGGGLAACLIAILFLTVAPKLTGYQNCSTDWDGRSNSEVCD